MLLGVLLHDVVASAVAQVSLPATADPLRVQGQARPGALSRRGGPVIQLEEAPVALPEGSEALRFQLSGIDLEGVTVYHHDELAPLWHDMIGREVSLADLYRVTIAITTKYRNDGWILCRAVVPAQELDKGVVRIEVIEGYIAEVSITGQVGNDALLRGYADRILATRPLQVQTLERYLLLLDDLPGTSAESVLAPVPNERGAASLTIQLQQKVVDVF